MKKRITLRAALLALLAFGAASCGKSTSDPGPNTAVSLTLKPATGNVMGDVSSVVWAAVNTAPGAEWTISLDFQSGDDIDWASITPESGVGPATGGKSVQINYLTNGSGVYRTVNVVLTSGGVTITKSITQSPGPETTPPTPPEETKPSPPMQSLTGWMELPSKNFSNPAIGLSDTMFIAHFASVGGQIARNYSMLYDKVRKISYWVAYPLCSVYTDGAARSEAWAYDPNIPGSIQPNLFNPYKPSGAGWDRGHQIPSYDRVSDTKNTDPALDANKQTFYYTNMTPQNNSLNSGVWRTLEMSVVNKTAISGLCDTLYVVTGAVLKTTPTSGALGGGGNESIAYAQDNNGANVAIPNYYFKVLVQRKITRDAHGNITSDAYTTGIGFWFPNKAPTSVPGGVSSRYAKTIRDIEALTGFNFFSNLSQTDQDYVEKRLDYSMWKGIVVQN